MTVIMKRLTWSLVFLLAVFLQFRSSVFAKPIALPHDNSTRTNMTGCGSGNHHSTAASSHSKSHKIKVAKFDFDNIATPFIVVLWVLLASLVKLGFHMTTRLSRIVPESCLIILLGATLGGILSLVKYEDIATIPFFTSRIFFLFLLPPIVLDAGYFLHTSVFYENIGTILLFAVVGTIFNTFTVGLTLFACTDLNINLLQMLLFSCLISAIDPVAVLAVFEEVHVNEVLYILVFGESLLNDAVTVVLYRLFEVLVGQDTIEVEQVFVGVAAFFVVSIGAIAIGIVWAFVTAFLTKYTNHVRVLEPIFVFSMSYMAYLTAELFHFSGIISIVTCAIVMRPYVDANLSQKSRIPLKYFMKMASSLSETIIFMILGVILFNRPLKFNAMFIFLTIVFITIYRGLGVVILTWLANKIGRLNKVGKVDQFIMAYGGLRGAVAFSLATLIDEKEVPEKIMLETTTIVVVLFTVFVQGTTIKPIVDFLKVKRSVKRKEIMLGEVNDKMMDHLLGGIQEIIQHRGHYYWKNLYQYVDVKYLRRWFMNHESADRSVDETLLTVYRKVAYRDAIMAVEKRSRSLSGSCELEEYESNDKDRRSSLALAPCVIESEDKFTDTYNHAPILSFLLGSPTSGTARRFSKSNILDETDTDHHALRVRRRSHTPLSHTTTIMSAKSPDDAALGDGERKDKTKKHGHQHGHHHGHQHGHRRHGHGQGHKNRHKHTHDAQGAHENAGVKLSDIAERDTPGTAAKLPEQKNHSEVAVDVDEVDMVKYPSFPESSSSSLSLSSIDSAYQSHSLLPSLADVEPSSPTVDMHFAVDTGDVAVAFTTDDEDVCDIAL